eukprot:5284158-Prymnesium_polylepis.1
MVGNDAHRALRILAVQSDHVRRLLYYAGVARPTRAVGNAVVRRKSHVHLTVRRQATRAGRRRAERWTGGLPAVLAVVLRLAALRRIVETAHVAAVRQSEPALEAAKGRVIAGVMTEMPLANHVR